MPPSTSAAPLSRRAIVKQTLIAASGNFLEWYDFATFGIFARELGETFFPAADANTASIQTFSVFAGAFLVRPLGGILCGQIGDRRGRQVALLLTILLMAAPTLSIGLLPGYCEIGVAAPLLLTLMRLIQGLAAGGELPGALVFAVESAGPQYRATLGALVQATGLGSLLASAVAAVLHAALGEEAVRAWGWRVPFWLGAGLALVSFCFRRNFQPTPVWLAAQQQQEQQQQQTQQQQHTQQPSSLSPSAPASAARAGAGPARDEPPIICTVLRTMPRTVLRIIASTALSMSGFYVLFVWLPHHLRTTGQIERAFLLNVAVMLEWAVCVVGAGYLADRLGAARVRSCRRCAMSKGRWRAAAAVSPIALVSSMGAASVAVLALPTIPWPHPSHHPLASPFPPSLAGGRPRPTPLCRPRPGAVLGGCHRRSARRQRERWCDGGAGGRRRVRPQIRATARRRCRGQIPG